MEYEIIVIVDENDADAQIEISKITQQELDIIRPLVLEIKRFQPYKGEWCPGNFITYTHNYPTGECLRKDMGEKSVYEIYPEFDEEIFYLFDKFCPYCEYGFHTIKNIYVYPLSEREVLL